MTILTIEGAQRIEQETGLTRGDIFYGREMSAAEAIYLKVPPTPILSLHVELCGGTPALVIYEQEVGTQTKPYMKGALHATGEDAVKDVKQTWAGLVTARQNGLLHALGEEVAVVFTGWAGGTQGQRWSWSAEPSSIRNIFSSAPISMLLCPQFEDWPPEYAGGPSPGKFISRLAVDQVIFVHSILFQGVTTLRHKTGSELMQLAVVLAQKKAQKEAGGLLD